jgi:hypothetical protein
VGWPDLIMASHDGLQGMDVRAHPFAAYSVLRERCDGSEGRRTECVDEEGQMYSHGRQNTSSVSSHTPCMLRTESWRSHEMRCDVVVGGEIRIMVDTWHVCGENVSKEYSCDKQRHSVRRAVYKHCVCQSS